MAETFTTPFHLSEYKIKNGLPETDTHKLIILETIDSTNHYAKELAVQGAKHNTVVLANHQTAGRGRLGRSFFSPSDTGLYMSIILKPELVSLNSALFTIAAGVSVCRAIKQTCQMMPQIKWVNDIFINGRKICGILAESSSHSGNIDYIIVGIGINVSTPHNIFPDELSNIAGSLGTNIDRNLLAAEILKEFTELLSSNNTSDIINEYKQASLVLGKEIEFTQNGIQHKGIAIDINIEGNLVVALKDNTTIVLKSGEISLGSSNFI
ncbi:MAG: biotin--[acetyl-CoA-carboxylase] ligase [Ruminococcaceae bacterium]|nr:biotin--[acetyl-CoA-carboxylase] ligase [Oscillospiraceae bacterium]